jgi:hypothetical protein
MYKYIIDVSNIKEFENADSFNTYEELINFFKKFDEKWLDENRIHTHRHHIIPKSEGGSDLEENIVKLTYRHHIKAHWLRAKQLEAKKDLFNAYKNYKSVEFSIKDSSIPKSIQELEKKLDYVIESKIKRLELISYAKSIWVSKNNKSIKIYENEFEEYKKDGWERKRIFKNPSTKTWVNNGIKNKYIEKTEISFFLEKNPNFKKGFKFPNNYDTSKNASYSTLNTKWMNKNGIRKAVKKEEVEIFLKNGWSMGSASTTNKGKTWKWSKNYHWYTNGEKSVLSIECPDGFKKGRLHTTSNKGLHKGKHWYTNGIICKRDFKCPEGFWPGRIYS